MMKQLFRLSIVVLFISAGGHSLSSSSIASAEIDTQTGAWPPEIVPLETFWSRNFSWPETQFPLISEDGTEVVVLHGGLYFDGDRSIQLDVYDVPAEQARYRHVLQHFHEDFASGLSDGQLVHNRVAAANSFLMSNEYQSMRPFFQIGIDSVAGGWPTACFPHAKCEFHPQAPGDTSRQPMRVQVEQRLVQFDFQTGEFSISRAEKGGAESAENDLVLRWPVIENRFARTESQHNCKVQAAPREAWIGKSPRIDGRLVLLLRIGFLAEELACLQEDEWQTELISQ